MADKPNISGAAGTGAEVVQNTNLGRMQEIGTTGLAVFGGYVYDEFLRDLQGARAARAYREIAENNPIASGIILAYRNVASHLDWHIEEHEEATSKDKAAYDFINEAFHDTNEAWDSTLSQILSEIIFGWSLHEIVYKKRDGKDSKYSDGKIGWKKFPIRAQESLMHWEYDVTNGETIAMIQRDPISGHTMRIPFWKSLLFRTSELKNNPEGLSLLRGAYIPYQYVRRIQEYEAIGVERDLAGLPVVWVPQEWLNSDDAATSIALNKMVQMVKDVRRNEREGLVLPMMYEPELTGAISRNKALDFELLGSGGSRQFDTEAIITRYNQQIGMSLLADFLTLGHDGVGSLALGAAKLDLWIMVVDSLCKSVAEVFTRHAIKTLLDLNGISYDHLPRLDYGTVENVDIGVLSTAIKALSDAGLLTPDEGTETWLRQKLDMPPVDVQGGAPPAADKLAQAAEMAKLTQDQMKNPTMVPQTDKNGKPLAGAAATAGAVKQPVPVTAPGKKPANASGK